MLTNTTYIILADDDEDDRGFFADAFKDLKIATKINFMEDGILLMNHLNDEQNELPHIIFLDLNMPKKSGMECLREIKNNSRLACIAIAIYSTSASDEDIEETFVHGANIYIKKPNDFKTLKNVLEDVVTINWQYHTSNLNRDNFLLKM
jgi:CheY-like chemotaxis protein